MCGLLCELQRRSSHVLLQAVSGAAPSLRQVPDNILERTFQIAGLAVQAVAEIHLDAIPFPLIDLGRAEGRAGRSIFCNTSFACCFIFQRDMAFLFFIMAGAGEIHVREFADYNSVIRFRQ